MDKKPFIVYYNKVSSFLYHELMNKLDVTEKIMITETIYHNMIPDIDTHNFLRFLIEYYEKRYNIYRYMPKNVIYIDKKLSLIQPLLDDIMIVKKIDLKKDFIDFFNKKAHIKYRKLLKNGFDKDVTQFNNYEIIQSFVKIGSTSFPLFNRLRKDVVINNFNKITNTDSKISKPFILRYLKSKKRYKTFRRENKKKNFNIYEGLKVMERSINICSNVELLLENKFNLYEKAIDKEKIINFAIKNNLV